MLNKKDLIILPLLMIMTMLISSCSIAGFKKTEKNEISSNKINLSMYRSPVNKLCFNRTKTTNSMLVDTHFHAKPFGGKAIPLNEYIGYFKKSGVLFATIFGIGQTLPRTSSCTYYLDCPGEIVKPSIINDIRNAEDYISNPHNGVYLTLSMTFMNLGNPKSMLSNLETLNHAYPKLFKWAGEANLVKEALFQNGHTNTPIDVIKKWKSFMVKIRSMGIPLTLHADIGNNNDQTKYLYLMSEVLRLYPKNKIIWAHMGLSKELTSMPVSQHLAIMKEFLDKYKNLYLDISWRVLDHQFKKNPGLYINFLNRYSSRIFTGTDFVASRDKDYNDYVDELKITSKILRNLNDRAYRNIVLGENYIKLLNLPVKAPYICKKR